MALTSTLFTGLSGLEANTTRLNVVGNNIANVNTVAFKASRALFKPQFYVTDSGGSAPSSNFGGTNPSQRGLGTEVSAIQKDFTAGSIEPTGKSTDLAIEGTGFFVVKGTDQTYTRDGSFTLDSNNELVTTTGSFVQGFGVDTSAALIPGKLQNLKIPLGASSTAEATQSATLTGNLDAAGLPATGASILNSQLLTRVGGLSAPTGATLLTDVADNGTPATAAFSVGQTFTLIGKKGSRDTAPETFKVTATSTLSDLTSFFNNGLSIDTSGAADPTIPTPGATIEADVTNPKAARIIIAGNTGTANSLELGANSFTAGSVNPLQFQDGTNAAGFPSKPIGESIHTTAIVYDSLGTPVTINVTAVFQKVTPVGTQWSFTADSGDNKSPTGNQIIGTGTLTFDSSGKLVTSTGTSVNIDRSGTGARSPFAVKIDFGGVTALASASSNLAMSKQDGSPLGSLASFSIGTDGIITGAFSNGLTRTLGQVAIANFNNPQGLEDKGGNMFAASGNSGTAVITKPLDLGSGMIRAGALEQSNVDLSKEFVNMIISSTGFSASSRVITTSNQLLTDLLNSVH
jgi:flagellar hook protein FlgE